MRFEEQHPDAFPHFTTEDGFMKGSGRPAECVCCDDPTTWFHKAAGLYFCCRECFEKYKAGKCGGEALSER